MPKFLLAYEVFYWADLCVPLSSFRLRRTDASPIVPVVRLLLFRGAVRIIWEIAKKLRQVPCFILNSPSSKG